MPIGIVSGWTRVKCLDIYLKSKEKEENMENFNKVFFLEKLFNYKKLNYKDIGLFDPLLLNKEYIRTSKRIYNQKTKETVRLKKIYIQFPTIGK